MREWETYNKFNDIDGGTIRTESRDSEIEAASEELFGLFLAVEREIWVDASATVHRNSPTAHSHSLTLSHSLSHTQVLPRTLSLGVGLSGLAVVWCSYLSISSLMWCCGCNDEGCWCIIQALADSKWQSIGSNNRTKIKFKNKNMNEQGFPVWPKNKNYDSLYRICICAPLVPGGFQPTFRCRRFLCKFFTPDFTYLPPQGRPCLFLTKLPVHKPHPLQI